MFRRIESDALRCSHARPVHVVDRRARRSLCSCCEGTLETNSPPSNGAGRRLNSTVGSCHLALQTGLVDTSQFAAPQNGFLSRDA